MDMLSLILVALGCIALLGFGAFGVVSIQEGEKRAARVSFAAMALVSSPVFVAALSPATSKVVVLTVLAAMAILGTGALCLPIGRVEWGNDVPQHRFDERDIMFARARLAPGSPEYESYYAMRPENRAGDERTRALPGLYSPEALLANPLAFAAAEASFALIEEVRGKVDGSVAPQRCELAPAEMTTFLKGLARYWGAYTVGIAELQPYHVYSHVGRGSGRYGAPITLHHRYAIAFTVEMDHKMTRTAPQATVSMESARQYVEATKIALQLAYFIGSLGYEARAHIDGNYRVIAPLVARDAGLGEIGRMGLLMTPELGPRVRLGVVTTDLPLIPDQRCPDASVLDFCSICRKCAHNCPSRSIPFGDREEINGAVRWRIDSDTCFRYWNTVGTDCGRCMAVCPYSHPNTLMHNLMRKVLRRSGVARRAALWLDDLFYGRKPASGPAPAWVPTAGPLATRVPAEENTS